MLFLCKKKIIAINGYGAAYNVIWRLTKETFLGALNTGLNFHVDKHGNVVNIVFDPCHSRSR